MNVNNEPLQLVNDPAADGRGHTVVIAEDERMLRLVVARFLRSLGFNVIEFADGETATTALKTMTQPIELLMLDVGLPRVNGIEAAKVAHEHHPEAAVLYMSGYGDTLFESGLQLRANERFIGKPFMLDALLRVVQDLLGDRMPAEVGAA